MANTTNLFLKAPRGRPLVGPRAIAEHIWGDSEKWRSVYRLPRETYGIVLLPGGLTAFAGWVDAALAQNACRPARRGHPPVESSDAVAKQK